MSAPPLSLPGIPSGFNPVIEVPKGTARINRLRGEDLEARFPGLLDSVLRGADT